MPNAYHNLLLLTAHVLLFGVLLGAYQSALPGLAAAGAGLGLLLVAWAGALLVRRLRQRQWVGAGLLALLVVSDGLALCGAAALLSVFSIVRYS